MITSWSLRLMYVMTGAVLIASTTLAADVQQMNGPIITPSLTEVTLQSGQNYTLSCKGKMPLQFKHQETTEENTESLFNMSQRTVKSGIDSEYEVALDLYNIDQYAVGYYACFDSTVDSSDLLNDLLEEPNNTAHISYIYVYVNGSNLIAPMRAYIVAKSKSKFLLECRPTTPDINVTLTVDIAEIEYDRYNPKIGFILDSDVLPDSLASLVYCDFESQSNFDKKEVIVHKHRGAGPLRPQILGGSKYFLQGETFVLNCTVKKTSAVILLWEIPGSWSKVQSEKNEYNYAVTETHPILYNSITIQNASIDDAGTYTCTSRNIYGSDSTYFNKTYLEEAPEIVIINDIGSNPIIVDNTFNMKLKASISSYPPVNVTFFLNNATLSDVKNKYKTKFTSNTGSCIVSLMNLDATDTGNYTIVARNKYNKTNSLTWDLRVKGAPRIQFGQNNDVDKRYLLGAQASLVCEVIGYPFPVINWIFTDKSGYATPISKEHQTDTMESLHKGKSVLKIPVTNSGNITCETINEKGKKSVTRNFIVHEINKGFGIRNSDKTWFSEGDIVELKCFASIYDFVNVTWNVDDDEGQFVDYENTSFSYVAKLTIDRITPNQSGNYTCYGNRINGTYLEEVMSVNVAETQAPTIQDPDGKIDAVLPYQPVELTCVAEAVPPPQIIWYKDGKQLNNGTNNITIVTTYLDYASISSIVKIFPVSELNLGKYECSATSQSGTKSKLYDLVFKEKPTNKAMIFGVIGAVFMVLIILLAYLTWKIRKEKQFRKELADAGLLHFKKGLTKSINPDLGIDEQAELLPYDEKFEFPPEKLHLGKQLGAGAFGVVYKAEARGIINAEESTTVAVKMVKKSADNMYIKALASELKIMVHLGKHINIVNLLGACTKNVGKRELSVIVEYCKFGNIHNYMQKHREVFIDQLTDNPDKNLGKINRGYSCSSGNSGMHSDYFGSNHTQETDNTFLNTANTNRSGRKVSETGYLQPEWRSNYESDYSDGRSPRPLFSRDLLAWSFQIARGMEYLASRKVLHGDLAARNILLAEDNVVKICDFGLARSIYKNDEYQKQENSPLPLKWLAIECMTDRIFSTQSDVWSFGIVLWELFSLAKTPYPNINPHLLLQWLSEGNRLEKPPYADDRLYEVMKHCWELKPTARPTFGQLQQILGSFLEDNVRNHYVDLNAAYMDTNVKQDGEEDYLAMVSAPDYNNLVTPSPHHYVNDTRSFFPPTPTQLQHDDEGYLQMSPATRQTMFNARPQGNKFDFDARKLSPRVSEASESTPMLTLNNLPRSGSESDHEGNSSPYLNMCPRIEEETDEVFEMKQNNLKNTQPSAVTNPTYITFSPEDEKKPQNFTNNYINVNAPNGLVT